MEDHALPESIGTSAPVPAPLTPKQEELCARLDELHARHGLKAKPSDMFRGAVFVARTEYRSNPDWIAQAANSLRDILYPFGKEAPNKEEALRQYGSVRVDPKFTEEVGRLLGSLTELAHHGNGRGSSVNYTAFTPVEFERSLVDFERIMFDVLARQVDVHKEIDDLLAMDPSTLVDPLPKPTAQIESI